MAKNWKKLLPSLLAIYGLLFPGKIVGQENLPITILKGIDQVGKQIIQTRKKRRAAAPAPQSSLYSIQPISSKYFPQCKVNPSKSNFPENVCRSDLPGNAGEAQGFKKMAIKNIAFLEGLLVERHDARHSMGMQCLQDASKRKLSDIQNVINRLKLESIKIKKGFEEFNQQNSKLLSEMRKINGELRGGSGQIDNLNKDFSRDFSPVCRDILTAKILSQAGRKGGLIGIRDNPEFVEKYDLANKAYSNEEIWKKELLEKIKKVKDNIVRYGPAVLEYPKKMSIIAEESDPDLDNSIVIAITKNYTQFKNEYEKINKSMKEKLNHSLPSLDENFSKNISNFAQSSKKYFKKKLVDECVMGKKYDLAMEPQKILNGLKQRNSTTQGTNVINYRNQLLDILNQDSFFGDKLAAIRKLDKKYNGSIIYTYSDPRAGVISRPPSEIYDLTIKTCTRQVVQDNTFGRQPSQSNISHVDQVDRQLQNLNKKAKTFTTDIANDIYQRVANCNGKTLKSGSCNSKTLGPQEKGFCISHATSCANAIRSCHKEVSDQINTRVNNLKKMGKEWDESVKFFITKQQNYLNTYLFPPVAIIMEQIRKHLPGATTSYNADTFIKMPLSQESREFGITMLNGGSLEELQQLPDLIEKNLIGMLEEQKKKLATEYNNYINDKKKSAGQILTKWKKLKTDCTSVESKIAKNAEKINRARQKDWSEKRAAAQDFCAKYDFVRSNPAAGCDSLEELYSDSIRTSGMVNPNVTIHLNRFMAYCNQFNNESTEGVVEEVESSSSLKQLCEEHDNTYENMKEPLMDMALTTVPEDIKSNVSDYLQDNDSNPDLIKELSSLHRRHLKTVRDLLHPSKNDLISQIRDELIRPGLQSKGEAYKNLNLEGKEYFLKWKDSDEKITLEDLFKIRKEVEHEKLENFFISDMKDQAPKILKSLEEAESFKPDSNDLCVQHMNQAYFEAAKNCAEDSKSNCLKNELEETSWNKHFTGVEKKLSQLLSHSKAVLADDLGEQAQGSCVAPLGTEPKQKKPSIFDFLFPGGGTPTAPKGIGI